MQDGRYKYLHSGAGVQKAIKRRDRCQSRIASGNEILPVVMRQGHKNIRTKGLYKNI